MRLYLVPLLFLTWGVAIAVGCTWTTPWLILLVPALLVQGIATVKLYRRHLR